ncbi:MAG: hypothetical protein RBU23_12665 [Candidatus Auribacterota bacterium]|jgi:hypothetical protein|nr:hypothetical protein [Candidatus Auribacterota bacterium]
MSNQAAFRLFADQSLESGTYAVSATVAVNRSSGFFAVSGTLSGTNPNIKIEYLTGSGSDFVQAGTPIVSSCSATPFQFQFYPTLAESLKIKVTNQGESSVNISLTLRFSEA